MTSLRCHEWDKHQSYRRDRASPPWIKVHRNLMQNRKWASLTDAEKGQLVSIWLLAADRDGEVPADPFLLKKICMLDVEPNIDKFISLGLLTPTGRQRGVKLTPERRQHDAPEAEAEAEEISEAEEKDTLGDEPPEKKTAADEIFEALWTKRPPRAGNDPKHEARKSFNARMRQGEQLTEIEAGLHRYVNFCTATGKNETEKVMRFSTFLGPSKPYLQAWTLPKRGAAISSANDAAIAAALGESDARH